MNSHSLSPRSPLLFSPALPPLRRSKTLILTHSRPLPSARRSSSSSSSEYSPDEVPIDEEFLNKYTLKENESEDEARRRNWIERGWAPWEEILTPEADFARKSLNEEEEVPLRTPEAIEAFRMLSPSYRRKKMEESGLSEEEYLAQQFAIKGEIPDPIKTYWAGGKLAVRAVPPRDWPPRGWEVDVDELEFIRGAHKLEAVRVDLEAEIRSDVESMCVDRYKGFMKQYKEWVAANKDRLEEESYKFDQDYYPGRRKRGKDYNDDMLELPYIYPGQICRGKVTTLHLYQGAFVDIGCVHDGWVPIKGNDWYWIRHHIKVGMHVFVEVLAKRDPYRFRFPIEMRFLYPNIDHLIFNRFDFPPIFHREEDTNPEQLWRESGRPPIPRKRPPVKMEEEPLRSDHPYVDRLWQLHVAEQMILDDEDANPEKYKYKKFIDDAPFDEENSVQYTKAYFDKALLPMTIVNTNLKELDLDAARAERQLNRKLRKEAKDRGEEFKVSKLRRNMQMDEYDLMHWRRSLEEREALIRDISSRKALGLPLEEPGRYDVNTTFWKKKYDPTNPRYRYDYWGEPKNSEKSREQRMTEDHNKSIVGKGIVWYEMSYEEAIKQRMRREARMKNMPKETEEKEVTSEEIAPIFDQQMANPKAEEGEEKAVIGNRPVRVYADGIYDLFHFGHARSLEQAKKLFPNTYLLVGCCNDELTRMYKGRTVMTESERYESLRHCRWVDEVIPDAPWVITKEFIDKHNIDYVAHDSLPYADASGAGKDVYEFVKSLGKFKETKRTDGISTSDVIMRMLKDYNQYVMRNLARGYTREELGVSYVKEKRLRVNMGLIKLREKMKQQQEKVGEKLYTVAKIAGLLHDEWVENADRWVAGFLEKFEEGCHSMGTAIKERIQERLRAPSGDFSLMQYEYDSE